MDVFTPTPSGVCLCVNSSVLINLLTTGAMLHDRGDYTGAIMYLSEAANYTCCAEHTIDPSFRAELLNELAMSYYKAGYMDMSEATYQALMHVIDVEFDVNNPEKYERIFFALNNFAVLLQTKGDANKSVNILWFLATVHLDVLSPVDERITDVLINLGKGFWRVGMTKHALSVYTNAYKMHKRIRPDDHTLLAQILINVIMIYNTLGDVKNIMSVHSTIKKHVMCASLFDRFTVSILFGFYSGILTKWAVLTSA